jgi:hypothetical protein
MARAPMGRAYSLPQSDRPPEFAGEPDHIRAEYCALLMGRWHSRHATEEDHMHGGGKFIGGLCLGLGLAYMLDPDRGARRRALVRDKVTRAGHKLADGVEATATDLRNRAGGAAAELRSKVRREDVGDEVLHERIRSAIGRAVSHPGAVQVSAHEGRATLQGQVLEDELDDLLRAVRQVRGVSDVVNELEIHRTPGSVPALQGAGRRDSEA